MEAGVNQVGRRERKKAATRASILEAATELFLARGFDEVSVREIADKADVSPTTVFAHFPQKEALLFYEEEEQRQRLVAAVRGRPACQSPRPWPATTAPSSPPCGPARTGYSGAASWR